MGLYYCWRLPFGLDQSESLLLFSVTCLFLWYCVGAARGSNGVLNKWLVIDPNHTANVIPVKITDNPRTDPCTICVKCKYYRDYLYHDMPVIVI